MLFDSRLTIFPSYIRTSYHPLVNYLFFKILIRIFQNQLFYNSESGKILFKRINSERENHINDIQRNRAPPTRSKLIQRIIDRPTTLLHHSV